MTSLTGSVDSNQPPSTALKCPYLRNDWLSDTCFWTYLEMSSETCPWVMDIQLGDTRIVVYMSTGVFQLILPLIFYSPFHVVFPNFVFKASWLYLIPDCVSRFQISISSCFPKFHYQGRYLISVLSCISNLHSQGLFVQLALPLSLPTPCFILFTQYSLSRPLIIYSWHRLSLPVTESSCFSDHHSKPSACSSCRLSFTYAFPMFIPKPSKLQLILSGFPVLILSPLVCSGNCL